MRRDEPVRPLKLLSGMSLSQVCHNHAYFHVGDGKLLGRYCMETKAFGSWPMPDKPEVTLAACSYLELKVGDGLWKFHTAYVLAHPEISRSQALTIGRRKCRRPCRSPAHQNRGGRSAPIPLGPIAEAPLASFGTSFPDSSGRLGLAPGSARGR